MNKVITIFNIKGGVGSTSFVHMLSSHIGCDVYEEKADYFAYLGHGKIIDSENIHSGIYDINTKQNGKLITNVLAKSDIIIVPTHFGFMDIAKTCSTISMAIQANATETKKASIFVLFNNLLATSKNREQKYRDKALEDIREAITQIHTANVAKKINPLYFRNSFAVFRDSEHGKRLIDHYITSDQAEKLLTINQNLEMLYQYVYHNHTDVEPFISDAYAMLYGTLEFEQYYQSIKLPSDTKTLEAIYSADFEKKTKELHELNKKILSHLYDLKFLDAHRKPIRDLRNLLIAIGEYIKDE